MEAAPEDDAPSANSSEGASAPPPIRRPAKMTGGKKAVGSAPLQPPTSAAPKLNSSKKSNVILDAAPHPPAAQPAQSPTPQAAGASSSRTVFAHPVINQPRGGKHSMPTLAPVKYNPLAAAASALATAEGVVMGLGVPDPSKGVPDPSKEPLSPKAMRKLSHNADEVRRRRRISMQLDRLKTMLNSPKADKASLLADAVNQLTVLTKKCHTLESELAILKGTAAPEPPKLLSKDEVAETGGAGEEEGEDEEQGDEMPLDGAPAVESAGRCSSTPPQISQSSASAATVLSPRRGCADGGQSCGAANLPPTVSQSSARAATVLPPRRGCADGKRKCRGSSSDGAIPAPCAPKPSGISMADGGGSCSGSGSGGGEAATGALQPGGQKVAADTEEAERAELQLQQWAQWGETSLMELLHKEAQTSWNYVCTRDGIQGFSGLLPQPIEATGRPSAPASEAERLDYCVKAETTIEVEPATLAAAYMSVDERQKWHSACQDSRLVEDIWPNTMRIAIFTYRTELPVFPRGYCALIHRASHRLPDGRTQIVITDRSVSHPAMPASRHFIFMTVFPSGLLITPLQHGERTHSHVKLVSHFHLRGTISPVLLQRIKGHRMLEACCFNYLHEFRTHVLAHYAERPCTAFPSQMQALPSGHIEVRAEVASTGTASSDASESTGSSQSDAAATLMHAAASGIASA